MSFEKAIEKRLRELNKFQHAWIAEKPVKRGQARSYIVHAAAAKRITARGASDLFFAPTAVRIGNLPNIGCPMMRVTFTPRPVPVKKPRTTGINAPANNV